MRTAIRASGATLLLSIVVLGCGSTSSDGPAAAGGSTITITRAFTFDPVELSVEHGAAVTWTNTDIIAHTVTSGTPGSPAGKFDKQVEPTTRFTFTFADAGTYEFFCNIHQSMRGRVVVK